MGHSVNKNITVSRVKS